MKKDWINYSEYQQLNRQIVRRKMVRKIRWNVILLIVNTALLSANVYYAHIWSTK